MLRSASTSENESLALDGRHALEYMVLCVVVLELRIGERRPRLPFGRLREVYKAAGIFVGQGPQQHRVHDGKHRGVSSNAESQCQYGDERKARTIAQRTPTVANVLKESFH